MNTELNKLELEKQSLIIKLNNIYNNPEKEKELNSALEQIEARIKELSQTSNQPVKSYLSESVFVQQDKTVEQKTDKIDFNAVDIDLNDKTEQKKVVVESQNDNSEYARGPEVYAEHDPELDEEYSKCEQLAMLGYVFAQCRLAEMYYNGTDTLEPDYGKAVFWLEHAAANGEPFAYGALGRCYLEGNGVICDTEKGMEYLKKSADSGCANDQHFIAFVYWLGKYGVEADPAKAQYYLLEADKNGDEEAADFLFPILKAGDDERLLFDFASKKHGQGDARGTLELALCYLYGVSVKQDYSVALNMLQQLSNQKNPEAMVHLAECYKNGWGVQINNEKAYEYYNKATELGCSDAYYELAMCYFKGVGCAKNYAKAYSLFQKSASNENVKAYYMVAECYFYGYGVNKNPEKACAYYYKGAKNGDAESQYMYGRCRIFGTGINKDVATGIEWVQYSSQNNYFRASWFLGEVALFGLHGYKKDYDYAVKKFDKALSDVENVDDVPGSFYKNYSLACYYNNDYASALRLVSEGCEKQHPGCQFLLGKYYYEGKVIQQDDQKAFLWFMAASQGGDDEATAYMGDCYEAGRGVAQNIQAAIDCWYRVADKFGGSANKVGFYAEKRGDYITAKKYYEKAAERGIAEAYHNLGYLCEKRLADFGTNDNLGLALAYYKKAADKGHAMAMNNIGAIYFNNGDFEKARFWLQKSAAQGNALANQNLVLLNQKIKSMNTINTANKILNWL